jgi:hypothetical protein
MKKALIGFAAIGAVVALPPLFKHISRKMSEHCGQMMAAYAESAKKAGTHEQVNHDSPRFTGDREPVGTA